MIFSAPMVRAILEGRKSQTRRIMKPQPEKWIDCFKPSMNPSTWISSGPFIQDKSGFLTGKPLEIRSNGGSVRCPFKIGDRFYVRETWAEADTQDGTPVVAYRAGGCIPVGRDSKDGPDYLIHLWEEKVKGPDADKWRSPIHMPEWAARLHCEITDVRAQRVQEISKDDVIAEGIEGLGDIHAGWHTPFAELWNNINGPDTWKRNDWVWVYTFKRVKKGGAA